MVFLVEKELLQHTSVYFSGLFRYDKTWLESRYGVVRLEDFKGDAFAIYELWLNTSSIDDPIAASRQMQQPTEQTSRHDSKHVGDVVVGNKNDIFETTLDSRLDLLMHCYFLADYIGAPGFQNDVMDAISQFYQGLHNTNSTIPLHNVVYICHKTTAETPLRRFLVDALRCGLSRKTLTEASEQALIPLDVAVSIAGDAIADVDEPWNAPNRCLPWLSNPCTFHVHPKGRQGDFNSPCTDPVSRNGREGEWDVKPWEKDYPGSHEW